MHCPRCGQQQVSEEIKFCSRCGFPLGLISEVLAHGGFLPQLADLHKTKTWFNKKNGVFFSFLWFIFFVPLLTSIFGGALGIEVLAIVTALVGVFGGFILFVGSLVFLKSSKEFQSTPMNQMPMNQQQSLYGTNQQHALPPQQSIPVSNYVPPTPGSWRETNDLVEHGSVTDETTRMLQNKETK